MGSVKFEKKQGRLKRALPGQDHYSALLFYSATLPAGFSANDRIKEVYDLDAAVEMGITADNANVAVKIIHYHISEHFRLNPNGILFVGIYDVPAGAHTFNEIDSVRIFAEGKLRRIGVWTSKAYAVGDPALLQGKYDAAAEVYAPLEIVYSPNFHGTADAALPSLATLAAPNVHVSIGQDGAALGKTLYAAAITATLNTSVGVIGAIIGAKSFSKVHENIGWVEKFKMSVPGGELDVPALSNGTLVKTLADAITKSNGTLDTKRLIFLKNYPSYTGTYFNDSHGACPADSDYAYWEDNETIDKAIRGVYQNLLPKVNGPVLIDKSTNKLSAEYCEYLQLEGGKALEQMEKDGELNGYTVFVNPDQDVNATNQIVVEIVNSKVGVSRNFLVNIGW